MKKWEDFFEKRWVSNVVAVCFGVILYMLLSNFNSVLTFFKNVGKTIAPIVVGAILAYLIDPVSLFFECRIFKKIKKETTRRSISVILSLIVVILLIVLFFISVIPSLVDSITGIFENTDNYTQKINDIVAKINSWNMGFNLDLSSLSIYVEELLNEVINYVSANLANILNVSRDIGSSVLNVAVGFILCIYFLTGKKSLIDGFNELREAAMPAQTIKKHNDFWTRCHNILIHYIGYDLLDGLLVGFANAIVMMILKMPYVSLISVIVGVTNLLPTFGPLIGMVMGSIILLLSGPVYMLWFIILSLILQTIDGYVLKPLLFGDAFGVMPVWTLIAIVLGGKLFGVAGIILAIPFTAVLTFLYHESFLPWLKSRKK